MPKSFRQQAIESATEGGGGGGSTVTRYAARFAGPLPLTISLPEGEIYVSGSAQFFPPISNLAARIEVDEETTPGSLIFTAYGNLESVSEASFTYCTTTGELPEVPVLPDPALAETNFVFFPNVYAGSEDAPLFVGTGLDRVAGVYASYAFFFSLASRNYHEFYAAAHAAIGESLIDQEIILSVPVSGNVATGKTMSVRKLPTVDQSDWQATYYLSTDIVFSNTTDTGGVGGVQIEGTQGVIVAQTETSITVRFDNTSDSGPMRFFSQLGNEIWVSDSDTQIVAGS